MSDAEQYRRFADECLILAVEEANGGPRLKVLLEMAVTWMMLAQKANMEAVAKTSAAMRADPSDGIRLN